MALLNLLRLQNYAALSAAAYGNGHQSSGGWAALSALRAGGASEAAIDSAFRVQIRDSVTLPQPDFSTNVLGGEIFPGVADQVAQRFTFIEYREGPSGVGMLAVRENATQRVVIFCDGVAETASSASGEGLADRRAVDSWILRQEAVQAADVINFARYLRNENLATGPIDVAGHSLGGVAAVGARAWSDGQSGEWRGLIGDVTLIGSPGALGGGRRVIVTVDDATKDYAYEPGPDGQLDRGGTAVAVAFNPDLALIPLLSRATPVHFLGSVGPTDVDPSGPAVNWFAAHWPESVLSLLRRETFARQGIVRDAAKEAGVTLADVQVLYDTVSRAYVIRVELTTGEALYVARDAGEMRVDARGSSRITTISVEDFAGQTGIDLSRIDPSQRAALFQPGFEPRLFESDVSSGSISSQSRVLAWFQNAERSTSFALPGPVLGPYQDPGVDFGTPEERRLATYGIFWSNGRWEQYLPDGTVRIVGQDGREVGRYSIYDTLPGIAASGGGHVQAGTSSAAAAAVAQSRPFLSASDFGSLASTIAGQVASLAISGNAVEAIMARGVISTVFGQMTTALVHEFGGYGGPNPATELSFAQAIIGIGTGFLGDLIAEEFTDALGIEGVGAQLSRGVVSSTVSYSASWAIVYAAAYVYHAVGAATAAGTSAQYAWTAAGDFNPLTAIGSVVGSVAGTWLARQVFGASEAQSAGSAIGAGFGAIVGSAINLGIGTVIGAFVGAFVGGAVGSIFAAPAPRSGAYLEFDPLGSGFTVGAMFGRGIAKKEDARALAQSAADQVNVLLDSIGGRVANLDSARMQYGLRDGTYYFEVAGNSMARSVVFGSSLTTTRARPDRYGSRFSTPGGAIDGGVLAGLMGLHVEGGHVHMKRVLERIYDLTAEGTNFDLYAPTGEVVERLREDLGVASDFAMWLDNPLLYEALIAGDADPEMRERWIESLSRARELRLDEVNVSGNGVGSYTVDNSDHYRRDFDRHTWYGLWDQIAGETRARAEQDRQLAEDAWRTTGGSTGEGVDFMRVNLVAVDLAGDGIALAGGDGRGSFDIDGDGYREQTGWLGSTDGFLVLDLDRNGLIEGIGEMFTTDYLLDRSTTERGPQSLAALDSNGDRLIDARDRSSGDLRIWVDADGDGTTDFGELQALWRFGIQRIDLDGYPARGVSSADWMFAGPVVVQLGGGALQLVNVELEFNPFGSRVHETDTLTWIEREGAESGDARIEVTERVIHGGVMSDTLAGTYRSDIIKGGDGADVLYGGGTLVVTLDRDGVAVTPTDAEIPQNIAEAFARTYPPGNSDWTIYGGGDDVFLADAADVNGFTIARIFGGDGFDSVIFEGNVAVGGPYSVAGTVTTWHGYDLWLGRIEAATGTDYGDVLRSTGADGVTLAGQGGADLLWGGSGNDRFDGGDDDDQLWGEAGDDWLNGGDGLDFFVGGAGDDVIEAEARELATAEQWRVHGGAGHDLLVLSGTEAVTIDLAARFVEAVISGDGNDTLIQSATSGASISGGLGDDVLWGGDGNDTLEGGGWRDRIYGGAGNDLLVIDAADLGIAREGDIVLMFGSLEAGIVIDISYEEGVDAIGDIPDFGGLPNWHFNSEVEYSSGLIGPYSRLIDGGDGFDRLQINDTIGVQLDAWAARVEMVTGGSGNDVIWNSGPIAVALAGEAGNDFLAGGERNDLLQGGGGNDTLWSWGGNDSLYGGDGNDVLQTGRGANWIDGGAGSDTVTYAEVLSTVAGVSVDLASETVLVTVTGEGVDTLVSVENAVGTSNVDTLIGNAAANGLFGGDGDDRLYGGGTATLTLEEGGTTVVTGGGDDFFIGGAGADGFYGGAGSDLVSYVGEAGAIIVNLASTATAGGGNAQGDVLVSIENVYASEGNDTIDGSAVANWLHGAGGNDLVRGGDGDDALEGGMGADVLYGGNGTDVASYIGSTRGVALNLGIAVQTHHWGDVGAYSFNGTTTIWQHDALYEIEDLLGSAHTDTLTGSSGANVLRGDAGSDTLTGAAGNDVLEGGDGDDLVFGGADGDDLRGGTGNDTLYGGDGTLADQVTGDAGDDVLFGGEGNEQLYGRSGDDVLAGGTGSDVLYGGTGFDAVSYEDTSSAVSVDLGAASGPTVSGATDVLFEIENAIGGLGNDWLRGDAGSNLLFGGVGNDGNDTLIGAQGADGLNGGAGNDVYSFDRGDGRDVIRDSWTQASTVSVVTTTGNDTLSWLRHLEQQAGGTDTLQLGVGIRSTDVVVGRDGGDLLLGIRPEGDTTTALAELADVVRIRDWFAPANRIETIAFTSGSVAAWTATDINGMVNAVGHDTFGFGHGDGPVTVYDDERSITTISSTDVWIEQRVLYGVRGTYLVVEGTLPKETDRVVTVEQTVLGGAGNSVLPITRYQELQVAGGTDVLVFDPGIRWDADPAQRDVIFRLIDDDLVIALRDLTSPDTPFDLLPDRLVIKDWVNANNRVETFYFVSEDGGTTLTTLDAAAVLANLDLTGSEGFDYSGLSTSEWTSLTRNWQLGEGDDRVTLAGGSASSILSGDGNDIVAVRGEGTTTLTGGRGNDTLDAGAGNDTYVFSRGDGADLIGDRGWGTTTVQERVLVDSEVHQYTFVDSTVSYTGGWFDPESGQSGSSASNTRTGEGVEDFIVDSYEVRAVTITIDANGGTADTLQLGAGIVVTDLHLGNRGNRDLVITLRDSTVDPDTGRPTDVITINDGISQGGTTGAWNVIETLSFLDGGSLGLSGFTGFYGGTSEADTVYGGFTEQPLWIDGGAGDDELHGNAFDVEAGKDSTGSGVEWLTGGAGNDRLYGGDGDDRYLYPSHLTDGTAVLGTGVDSIFENQGTDTLIFGNLWQVAGVEIGGTTLSMSLVDDSSSFDGTLVLGGGTIVVGDYLVNDGTPEVALGVGAIEHVLEARSWATLNVGTIGGSGNDFLTGRSSGDSFAGGDGRDALFGGGGTDTLYGGNSDDFLLGGAGNDRAWGGSGNDTISYAHETGGVKIDLAGNTASVSGSGFTETADSFERAVGGLGSDTLIGRGTGDILWGGAGNDTLESRGNTVSGSTDSLYGGTGTDFWSLNGVSGNLTANLATGVYTVDGTASYWVAVDSVEGLIGGSGNDALAGGERDETFYGGSGNDTYSVMPGAGTDTIGDTSGTADTLRIIDIGQIFFAESSANGVYYALAGAAAWVAGPGALERVSDGTNVLQVYEAPGTASAPSGSVTGALFAGDTASESFTGSTGNDYLSGMAGNDTLTGGGNNDWLNGGFGDDVLTGGSGSDAAVYSAEASGVAVTLANTTTSAATVGGAASGDLLYDIENIAGTADDDTLVGNDAGNTFWAGWGNDTLAGMIGSDVLDGHDHDDSLHGGAGNDVLYGSLGNDTLQGGGDNDILYGGDGEDVLSFADHNTTISFTLDAAQTTATVAGTDTFWSVEGIEGGLQGDRLIGDDRDNIIIGGGGADYVRGGLGGDQLYGGALNDTVNRDTLSYEDSGSGVVLDLGGADGNSGQGAGGTARFDRIFGFEVIIGSNHDDAVAGGHVAETFYGGTTSGGGDDVFAGGRGNDIFYGGDGADSFDGGFGIDQFEGGAGDDYAFGGSSNDLTDPGQSVENEAFWGGDGDDSLAGGEDNDALYGGNGNDVYRWGLGDGNDRVWDLRDVVTVTLAGGTLDTVTAANTLEIDSVFALVNAENAAGGLVFGFIDGGAVTAEHTDGLSDLEAISTLRASDSGESWAVALPTITTNTSTGNSVVGGEAGELFLGVTDAFPIYGGKGDDLVFGGDGNDVLYGGEGDDLLVGAAGNDSFYGGDGIDLVAFSAETGTTGITASLDTGSVSGGSQGTGENVSRSSRGVEGLIGTRNADVLSGSGFDDTLIGMTGDDSLSGAAGNDQLAGGAGNDRIIGDAGDDLGLGGTGNDVLDGGSGNDALAGDEDHDVFYGGSGDDTQDGGQGNDTFWADEGADSIVGGTGYDCVVYLTLSGTVPSNSVGVRIRVDLGSSEENGPPGSSLLANAAGDQLSGVEDVVGTQLADVMFGNAGWETLQGMGGSDTLFGGSGDDRLVGDGVLVAGVTHYGGGDDTLDGGQGNDLLYGGAGNDIYRIRSGEGSGNDSIDETGGNGNDTLLIDEVADLLGAERIDGSTDLAIGDRFGLGGVGHVAFGSGSGAVDFVYGDAEDQQWAVASGTTGGSSADLVAGTSGIDTLYGAAANDLVFAGAGNDTLYGGDGDDTLAGGTGNDRFYGGTGIDLVSYVGIDLSGYVGVTNGVSASMTGAGDVTVSLATGEVDVLFSVEGVIGSQIDDQISGSTMGDRLHGGRGNDALQGLDGNDSLFGGSGNDTLTGAAGNDTLNGGAGIDTLYGGTGDDTLEGASGQELFFGGDGVDVISYAASAAGVTVNFGDASFARGGASDGDAQDAIEGVIGSAFDDSLVTSNANDVLAGGAGNDTLVGRQGLDTYRFNRGDGRDYIDEAQGAGDWSGINTIHFGPGIDRNDLLITQSGQDLVISIRPQEDPEATPTDVLTLRLWQVGGNEHFVFESNTVNSGQYDWSTFTTLSPTAGRTIYDSAGLANVILFTDIDSITNRPSSGGDTVFGGTAATNTTSTGSDTIDAGAGNDHLYGWDGADTLTAGYGIDYIYGGNDADTAYGGASGDSLFGEAANDYLDAGAGDDWVYGGDGNDIGVGGADRDSLFGGTGNDTLIGAEGTDSLYGEAGDDTADGGEGNDLVFGGVDNDLVLAGAGDDLAEGNDGSDRVYGGDGNDNLIGRDGSDSLWGGAGNDALTSDNTSGADTSDDWVDGGDGDDWIDSAAGNDVVHAGSGNDFARSQEGHDSVLGGDGRDTIEAGTGNDVVAGGTGNDTLYGGDGNDVIAGGDGNDHVYGGSGNDAADYTDATGNVTVDLAVGSASGAAGNDTFASIEAVIGSAHADTVFGSTEEDTFYGGQGDDFFRGLGDIDLYFGGEGHDVVSFRDATVGITIDIRDEQALHSEYYFSVEGFEGGYGNDVIWGGGGDSDNQLYGAGGRDTVHGWYGDDTVFGGDENDVVAGYYGSDTIYGDAGSDTVDGASGEIDEGAGNDVLYGGLDGDTIIGRSGNDIAYGGDGVDLISGNGDNDTAHGEGGNDVVWSDDGADVAYGGDGDDDFDGGQGSDTLYGGVGNDRFYVYGGAMADDTWYGGDGSDMVAVTGDSNDSFFGGEGNDHGLGGGGDDFLAGGAGNDTLDGGLGNDVVSFAHLVTALAFTVAANGTSNHDTFSNMEGVEGGQNDDTLVGRSSFNDIIYGSGGFDSIYGLSGADRVFGGDGNDRIEGDVPDFTLGDSDIAYGDAGNDIIWGFGGADLIYGGAGNDDLDAGYGGDTVYGGDGNDGFWMLDGNPTIGAHAFTDLMFGGNGNDIFADDRGDDIVYGDAGDDVYRPGAGNDVFYGGDGIDSWDYYHYTTTLSITLPDTSSTVGSITTHGSDVFLSVEGIFGSSLSDSLTGNAIDNLFRGHIGNDTLTGLGGNDTLAGEADNDLLYGGDGNDFVIGAAGDDSIYADDAVAGSDIAEGGDGNDLIYGGMGSDTISGDSNNDRLYGDAGDDELSGGSGNDTLVAGAGNDGVYGGTGTDILYGDAGDDVVNGSAGNDTLYGGDGNDAYRLDLGSGNDSIVETSGSSTTDRLELGAGIEHEQVWFSMNGSALQVSIVGSAADSMNLVNWSGGAGNQLDQFRTSDGQQLVAADVAQLVQAMATWTSVHGGSIPTSTAQYDQPLLNAIAAVWHPLS